MAKKKNIPKGVSSQVKNGQEYWRFWNTETGGYVWTGPGQKGFDTACLAKGKQKADLYERRDLKAGLIKKKAPKISTVKKLLQWWASTEHVQELKAYDRYMSAIQALNAFFKGSTLPLDGDDIEQYRVHRIKHLGKAVTTANNELTTLRAAFNLARKRGKIPADWVPGDFMIKGHAAPRRRVTREEYKALLDHAGPDFRDVLICAWESAMRITEIRTLTPSQVVFGQTFSTGETVDYINLGVFDTKNNMQRCVPVSPALKEVLERRMQGLGPEDPIFTRKGLMGSKRGKTVPWSNMTSMTAMKATCALAGVTYGDKVTNKKGEKVGIVIHCFRHTRTSLWVEMGWSDQVVRMATGHKSLEAFNRYIHLDARSVFNLVKEEKTETWEKPGKVPASV